MVEKNEVIDGDSIKCGDEDGGVERRKFHNLPKLQSGVIQELIRGEKI
jgi:hypothetical protein